MNNMKTIELSKVFPDVSDLIQMGEKVSEAEKKMQEVVQQAEESLQTMEQVKSELAGVPVDSIGHAKVLSADLSELPTVCGYPLIVKASKAPDTTPGFIGQFYIDTVAKKVYQAVGVSNAGDYKVLN